MRTRIPLFKVFIFISLHALLNSLIIDDAGNIRTSRHHIVLIISFLICLALFYVYNPWHLGRPLVMMISFFMAILITNIIPKNLSKVI